MTFLICNIMTGACTVRAPTPELIEREFTVRKRGFEQAISEVPDVLGITLENHRNFPKSMILDGVAVYQRRKQG